MIERCSDCYWFAAKEKECRKNPPTVWALPHPMSGEPVVMGFFPATRADRGCGSFQAKEAA